VPFNFALKYFGIGNTDVKEYSLDSVEILFRPEGSRKIGVESKTAISTSYLFRLLH